MTTGSWLGTNKIYKPGYLEKGTDLYSNFDTSLDNIYTRLWDGGIADSNNNLYVNSGYVSGDEDAFIYFNATTKYLQWNYGASTFFFNAALLIQGALGSTGAITTSNDSLRSAYHVYVNYDYASGDENATIYFNATTQSLAWDYGESLFIFSAGGEFGGNIKGNSNIYVNSDYVSGDEDAIINFNNGMGSITLEYLSTENVPQFAMDEKLNVNMTINSSSDIPNTNVAFVHRVGATYDFSTWGLTGTYGLTAHFVQMENKVNESDPNKVELVAGEFQGYAIYANSKAAMYGVDVFLGKKSPCVTDNYFIGNNVILSNDRDPGTNWMYGTGFRASSQDMTGYTGVRQHTAFLAQGGRGWKYGFLYIETDGTTTIASIDYTGAAYLANSLDVGGDPESGVAGRLRLTNGYTGYVDGSGQTAPYGITGENAPTFAGYVKFYTGEATIYLPAYTAIQ